MTVKEFIESFKDVPQDLPMSLNISVLKDEYYDYNPLIESVNLEIADDYNTHGICYEQGKNVITTITLK